MSDTENLMILAMDLRNKKNIADINFLMGIERLSRNLAKGSDEIAFLLAECMSKGIIALENAGRIEEIMENCNPEISNEH